MANIEQTLCEAREAIAFIGIIPQAYRAELLAKIDVALAAPQPAQEEAAYARAWRNAPPRPASAALAATVPDGPSLTMHPADKAEMNRIYAEATDGVIASYQAQGKNDGTALDTHRRTATGDRRTSPDLQHLSSNGQQQGSPRVASDSLRGGTDLVVGDCTGPEPSGGARIHQPLDATAGTSRPVTTALQQRIQELAERHGSMRAAARVLMVDHTYLYRLSTGDKDDPGDELLRKLKLRRVVTYERTDGVTGPDDQTKPQNVESRHDPASHPLPGD